MRTHTIGLTLAAFLASTVLSQAQHAVPRGGGSGGSSSGGGSGSGVSGSGGSHGGGSSSGGSSGVRSGGGSDDSNRAVPRHPGGSKTGGRSGGDAGASRGRSGDGDGGSVSGVSRPQGGQPVVGYAVPRGTVAPPGRPGGDFYYFPRPHSWYYNPWGWGTFGLGYVWDPFWFGGNGLGYPGYGYPGYGYPGYAYPGYGYPGYGAGYSGYGQGGDPADGNVDNAGADAHNPGADAYVGEGALRIKVKPREAKVVVDGYFAGTVDDFDGNFQKLHLREGAHKVQLEADGFEPMTFDVLIVAGQTVNYKGELRKR